MTYARKTLADLKQSLADRHDSGTMPTAAATLTLWTRLLNRGQAYCADRLRLLKSTTLTTSSGTIALPIDFILISRVFNSSGTEQKQIAPDDVASQDNAGFFWIEGNQTDGFTLNAPTNEAWTVEYAFRPTDMSSDSDVCVIPDPEAVVAFAYAMLRKSETDPINDADSSLQECDERLKELNDANTINANFNGFTFLD
jgi:hypothetical protein